MNLVCELGIDKHSLDTPTLLLDLDAFQRNVERMVGTCRSANVDWRPHIKGIKTPAIAHLLLERGAIGVTCAKLGEAEVMAASGIRNILVANQVVGSIKALRLASLQSQSAVIVAVDSVQNAKQIHEAATYKGVRVPVVVEVNTGQNRAGVEPGAETLSLVRQIANYTGISFRGLMTWEAHAAPIKDSTHKELIVREALEKFVSSGEMCRKDGHNIEIMSCGGTATYWLSATHPGITEIQAGGGVFCDMHYRNNYGVPNEYALTVMTTVTSRPNPFRVICDAGKKAMSIDMALPSPVELPNVKSVRLSAEHTAIELHVADQSIKVGDRLEFIVGYSDTTVHLHDQIYGTRNGQVESIWDIQARGRLR